VAAVLNITPDHLDRHGTLDAYVRAKARILEHQGPGDCAVLNADDEQTAQLAPAVRADLVWFSRRRRLDHGVFVRDGWIVSRLDRHEEAIGPVAEISLRGQHNVENVLAAAACALWVGLTPEPIREGIAAFRAVAHRIEFVRELAGVQYYNDSKGTNVESTLRALEGFAEPVLLIAGGKGKGQDFAPLAAAARGRVKRALLIGEDAARIEAALQAAGVPTERSSSLADALEAARAAAVRGDVVLLSPACASFDMFDNYEHRGDTFKQLVLDLTPGSTTTSSETGRAEPRASEPGHPRPDPGRRSV
jgi:UDP-N-acetylmuramoylalanine--D-glutamate ligase